mmetsp:Transcript_8373/g.28865  ORF Transcript_8373/g.28865 Transcript_8373/m.28865 type:complete len:153 (-) Transcript_8373:107-565(-)
MPIEAATLFGIYGPHATAKAAAETAAPYGLKPIDGLGDFGFDTHPVRVANMRRAPTASHVAAPPAPGLWELDLCAPYAAKAVGGVTYSLDGYHPARTLFRVVATPWAAATWHRRTREEHALGPLRDPPRAGNRRELRAGARNQPTPRLRGGF